MKTIKLPIQNKIDISELQRVYSSCVRFCYNRFKEDMNELQIRHVIKDHGISFKPLDSWFVQSAIYDAHAMFDADKKKGKFKRIFGGKKSWKEFVLGKISKAEFKFNRLMPLTSVGEATYDGNRKFTLDIITNNQMILKINKDQKISITLPKLRKNMKNELFKLEEAAQEQKLPYQVRLTNDFIYLSFDEVILHGTENLQLNENRFMGIDMNPNFIGLSILEIKKDESFKVIHFEVLDLTLLTAKSKEKSFHPKTIHLNNKREFEHIECVKHMVQVAKNFQCGTIVVEDLSMKPGDRKKGRNFNRLCNNVWNRNLIFNNLKKRCGLSGIRYVEINPAYTSFIGNILYAGVYPDMVGASVEIARRGAFKYQKGKFYPDLCGIESLSNRWKEAKDWSFRDWRELWLLFKESKLKYRYSLEAWLKKFHNQNLEFFRKTERSCTKVYRPCYQL